MKRKEALMQQLTDYVRGQRKEGKSFELIRNELVATGHPGHSIREAILLVDESEMRKSAETTERNRNLVRMIWGLTGILGSMVVAVIFQDEISASNLYLGILFFIFFLGHYFFHPAYRKYRLFKRRLLHS